MNNENNINEKIKEENKKLRLPMTILGLNIIFIVIEFMGCLIYGLVEMCNNGITTISVEFIFISIVSFITLRVIGNIGKDGKSLDN